MHPHEQQLFGAFRALGLDAATRIDDGGLTVCCPRCAQPTRLELAERLIMCPVCSWHAEGEPWDMAQAAQAARPAVAAADGAFPLPVSLGAFVGTPEERPAELVAGILFRGTKMVIGGPSKARKSWTLIDLAISVSCGMPWWGIQTRESRVCLVNFELAGWMMAERLAKVIGAKRLSDRAVKLMSANLHLWNLRGRNASAAELVEQLITSIGTLRFDLLILDPAYKMLGDADENSATDIARLMDALERLARETGAAIVFAHHFAKGDASGKNAVDRMSGSGVWARDPDSIMVLTPPPRPKDDDDDDGETRMIVETALRAHRPLPPFKLVWRDGIFEQDGSCPPVSPVMDAKRQRAPKGVYKPRSGSLADRFGPVLRDMPPLRHSREGVSECASWLATAAGIPYEEAFKAFQTVAYGLPAQDFIVSDGTFWRGSFQ